MFCLGLTTDRTDDPLFVSLITRIIAGAVVVHRPIEVRIFKIDNWFDHKWLGFSGKLLGMVGFWRKRLTVPPFVANRIVGQCCYVFDVEREAFEVVAPSLAIHHQGRAADNLHRYVNQIAPTAALFWYSGNTAPTGRGSLMGYIPIEGDHWPWFLAFARDPDWRVARRKEIHEYEVRVFQDAGEPLCSAATDTKGDRPRD